MHDWCGEVVIKDDLRIAGERVKIVSQNKIQIDCEFEGDVTGPEVVVSERGKVTGKCRRRPSDCARQNRWRHPRENGRPTVHGACGGRYPPRIVGHRCRSRVCWSMQTYQRERLARRKKKRRLAPPF